MSFPVRASALATLGALAALATASCSRTGFDLALDPPASPPMSVAPSIVDASAGVDASPVRDASLQEDVIAPPAGTCGFEIAGDVQASITGGVATECACGTEIPFLAFTCAGSALGTSYSITAQYLPTQTTATLTASANTWVGQTEDTLCTATALDGSALPEEPYAIGEPISIAFACPRLVAGDGSVVAVSGGTLSGAVAAKP